MNYLIAVENVLLGPAWEIDGVGLGLGFVRLTRISGESYDHMYLGNLNARSYLIMCPKTLGCEASSGFDIFSSNVLVRSLVLPWGWQWRTPRQSGSDAGDWLARVQG